MNVATYGWSPFQKFFCGQENYQLCTRAPTLRTIILFHKTSTQFNTGYPPIPI